jgi:hypothetical protein
LVDLISEVDGPDPHLLIGAMPGGYLGLNDQTG